MQDFGVRGFRRLAGLVAAALAAIALLVGIVFASMNLAFQLTATEAVGEVVAVTPVRTEAGEPRPGEHVLTVEYPDRNGQFRRFDERVRGEAPAKNDEIAVHYRMGPPVEARIANYWWIWRSATLAGSVALGLGLVAEELLRNRRRLVLQPRAAARTLLP